ncbi:arabinan endo-1,5-alpha-L-arabinosidase [Paenibacillus sonchi]|uniref:arabinan endo-1,5-alpha-L-arabinosidase n=1 Tax=Paenibacillus sonchi TaxID=373687 RepID=UPI001E3B28DC|nr:arabinan endo-1,5-alpha-L-arabinosidase [Paenibacillus sonchi]MCE3199678.1 arabinan endo-1,5-alpha-L-arabinosidase [Paenibacillus sonchi]
MPNQLPEPAGDGLVFPESPGEFKLYDTSILELESEWGVHNAHDPGIIKTDQGYYVFSTDVRVGGEPVPGVMVRKSTDLIHWEWVQYALPGIPQVAMEWANASNLWAPDVVKADGKYRMYYSASSFGSRQSLIGLQTSASIEGPWTDEGVVLATREEDALNAIDANVLTDAGGRMWMVYGSFFGGIHITELDRKSGKPKQEGFGQLLAIRDPATEDGAVEGPYIVYNEQFKKYYLFVSYDSLFEDYNVRVARSDSITGPYTDAQGRDMKDSRHFPQHEVGVKVLGGYRFGQDPGWIAPGHNSVLNNDGTYYMVHHARGGQDKRWPYLHIRKILWTGDGWPVVSPERYAGETEQNIPPALIPGLWERLLHDPAVDGQVEPQPLEIHEHGGLTGAYGAGKWTFDGQRTLTLVWNDIPKGEGRFEKVQLLPAWDWEEKRQTLVFTGLNEAGISSWGKKSSSS